MGMTLLSMTHSDKLEAKVEEFEAEASEDRALYCLSDVVDMASTVGSDNDGSYGPELVDNGVALAFAARDYSPKAVIFYAMGEDTCYYQFGLDEDDAFRRLEAAIVAD